MIQLDQLKNFFPPYLREKPTYSKYIFKEYLQLLILDYLTTTPYIRNIVFIGGTNLRLTKGIERFSEDLDFDCKNMSRVKFIEMTDGIIKCLLRNGFNVEPRDKENNKLKAYRRNLFFPELLFNLGLSGYRNERFLIKIESQDQEIEYDRQMANIKGCGFFFSFPVPTDKVICAMKISALLSRQKGRDFYDSMFLLDQTQPDYSFLSAKCGIKNVTELKKRFSDLLAEVDLTHKSKDFEHLVFRHNSSKRILLFGDFIKEL